MVLRFLETSDYRNLDGGRLEFSDGINLLYGHNAAGKTNTLEALYLFAAGRSVRTRNERELVRIGKDSTHIKIGFDRNGVSRTMSAGYMLSGASGCTRRMKVDSAVADRVSEFLGVFRAVLFTPDHLDLVKGAPEGRRHFVDAALCQIKPGYIKSLNRYEKVLSERNAYLRRVKYGEVKPDKEYLDVTSTLLSQNAAVIIKQRASYISLLAEHAANMYGYLTGEKEKLFCEYSGFSKNIKYDDEKLCAKALEEHYARSYERDMSLGRTFSGPHRDDLLVYISNSRLEFEDNDENDEAEQGRLAARTFGSQGQQRSAVLALKLAEGEIVKQLTGEYPVFLLDDLFSELDENRRNKLVSLFGDRQAVITSCEEAFLSQADNVYPIKVEGGKHFAMFKKSE